MERLDKFLCDSGVGTRSQVKAILKSGRVAVDGKPEKDSSRKIDPNTQTITLDGEVHASDEPMPTAPVFQSPFSGVCHMLATILMQRPHMTATRGYSVSSI